MLLDFGLAAEQDEDGQHRSTEEHLVGTAAYMAPEQAAEPAGLAGERLVQRGGDAFRGPDGPAAIPGRHAQGADGEAAARAPAACRAGTGRARGPERAMRRAPAATARGPSVRDGKSCGGWGLSDASEIAGRTGPPVQLPHPLRPRAMADHVSSAASGIGTHCDAALADMRLGRPVAVYLHGLVGGRKDGAAPELPGRTDRAGRRRGPGGPLLRARVGPVQGARQPDRLPWAATSGGCRRAEVAAFLPRDVGSLARVFPCLRRVEAVAQARRRGFETPDPQELRRRAFAALRELLARLGDRKPLILAIDDLQWGDVDSAALLVELLRPPDAPVLLFLATYRSEDRVTSPLLQALFRRPRSWRGTPLEDQGAEPRTGRRLSRACSGTAGA